MNETEKQQTLRVLNDLAGAVESDPALVAEQTAALLPILREHYVDPAYGWALALRAQACRFLDDLAGVLEATAAGTATFGEGGPFVAQLHLEAGMALNQFGGQFDALEHLRLSVAGFRQAGDEGGEAWALVSLADALAGIGYPEDPFPYLDSAIEIAERRGDDRVRRRALKQRAVALRHRGRVTDAFTAISLALDGQSPGHTRANFQLERGHLLAMTGQYAAADDDYLAAEGVYAETGDALGLANCARALAINALILGRNREGLLQLDMAAAAYREIENASGLAYVLRERALVRLAGGDGEGAATDATEGTALMRLQGDQLGLAGMLRTAARIAHSRGDQSSAVTLLSEAEALVADGSNPLAEAGILLMRAEVADHRADQLEAAQRAAAMYADMGVATGQAHALTFAARAQADGAYTRAAVQSLRDARTAWIQARLQVAEPARRADHAFALRDVVTNALRIAADLADPHADQFAADLLLLDAPIGLRHALRTGDLGARTREIVRRAHDSRQRSRDGAATRALLQHLSVVLATLDSDAPSNANYIVNFDEFRDVHPTAAILAVGQPTRDSELPAVWAVPGSRVHFQLRPLNTQQIDAIDDLGRAVTTDRTSVLWAPHARGWQTTLADALLPAQLIAWLLTHRPAELVVTLPSILAHIPLEALLIDGEPLGVLSAVRRVPVVTASPSHPRDTPTINAYLDPALSWSHERAAFPQATADPASLRAKLGPRQLILVGCHGDAAMRAEGSLTATDGTPVLDAIDLLSQPLHHSIVVLESCFSGRYFGSRTGEQLNLATVALLAGASDVIAGLFALPANDASTGQIAGHTLRELRAGTAAPEALRRGRAAYWRQRQRPVPLPGTEVANATMPSDAPWAWAGLCAFGR